jgi:hypothetical protein
MDSIALHFGDIHDKSLSRGKKPPDALRRSAKIDNATVFTATFMPHGGVPAVRRTRHPFAVSGPSGEPSQKIEFMFSCQPRNRE